MGKKVLAVLSVALLLQACGTNPYIPTEYELRAGVIPAFDTSSDVRFVNAQSSMDQQIVHSYMGNKFASNYHDITEVMVQQAAKELKKNGRPKSDSAPKSVDLKVTFLESKYIVMFWKSKINYQVKLGSGETFDKEVFHSSGNVIQDLNGCIAESVLELLKDERVRSYLAS